MYYSASLWICAFTLLYGIFWSHSTSDPCTLKYQCLRLILSNRVSGVQYPTFLKEEECVFASPSAPGQPQNSLSLLKKGRDKGLNRKSIFLNLLTLFLQTFCNHLIQKIKGKLKSIYTAAWRYLWLQADLLWDFATGHHFLQETPQLKCRLVSLH